MLGLAVVQTLMSSPNRAFINSVNLTSSPSIFVSALLAIELFALIAFSDFESKI